MSKISHIISVIHYTIRGAVCFQFTNFPCDDWENIYTLSYYHHKSEVWTINHCLGLGHETMVCAVCLFVFFSHRGNIMVFWIHALCCYFVIVYVFLCCTLNTRHGRRIALHIWHKTDVIYRPLKQQDTDWTCLETTVPSLLGTKLSISCKRGMRWQSTHRCSCNIRWYFLQLVRKAQEQ